MLWRLMGLQCVLVELHTRLMLTFVPRRETAELAVDRHVRSGNVVGLGTGLIVRALCSKLFIGLRLDCKAVQR